MFVFTQIDNNSLTILSKIFNRELNVALFGKSEFADFLIDKLNVDVIIDETYQLDSYKNIKIINNLKNLDTEKIVISTILNKPWFVKRKLDNYNIVNFDAFIVLKYLRDYLNDWDFNYREILNYKNYVFDKIEEFKLIFGKLEDFESKNSLYNYLNFKLDLDISYLKFSVDNQQYQYFEKFIELPLTSNLFIDIGACDGRDTLNYFKFYSNPNNKAILFEPNISNNSVITANLEKIENSQYRLFNMALGDSQAIVEISDFKDRSTIVEMNENSAGNIHEIEQNKLDSVLIDNIFIFDKNDGRIILKMDVEGYELRVLAGAQETINKLKPIIAISVYHNLNDILSISNFILSIHNDYKVYFRHYTEGVDEGVMFFL